MSAPVLHTDRLILRRPEPRDADGYVDFYLSGRARFVGGTTQRHRAWLHFAADLGHWEMLGFGLFAVESKETGACIGMVGPFRPGYWPETELGWLLWPQAEGRGFGYEAALAARDYARETLGWVRPVSYIDPANTRSIALAKRLGAVRDPEAAVPDGDTPETCHVYRHPEPEAA